MLKVAKERNAEGQISYALASIDSFDYFEEFDVITSFFGSLDYILTDKDFDGSAVELLACAQKRRVRGA